MASRANLAKIHIARKQLGMDEDTYRAMLQSVGGVQSSKDLDDAGATKVLAAATHGIFSGQAFSRLEDSVIEEIVVTDTIDVEDGSAGGKVQVLSVDRILADTVHNVFCDESVSEIFAGENQLF